MQPEITRWPAHSNSAVFRSYPRMPAVPAAAVAVLLGLAFPQWMLPGGPIGGQQKETEKITAQCREREFDQSDYEEKVGTGRDARVTDWVGCGNVKSDFKVQIPGKDPYSVGIPHSLYRKNAATGVPSHLVAIRA
ncbi:hypothetical protein B0H11DRAFT_2189936 [Mycena galericulata]|nr:hypothetical protein B0H11DRAFT_2189936 [Mycena galericulata]